MSLKREGVKEFESALTPENKRKIEEILDAVNPSSTYSGDKAFDFLVLELGDKATLFLKNLLDLYDDTQISQLTEISDETRKYLNFLFGRFAYKLRGVLSGRILERPDEWIQFRTVSVKYDAREKELLMKIAIQKTNKECVIIEDTWGNLLNLIRFILARICEAPEIEKFREDVHINKDDMESIKKSISKLEGKLFIGATEGR